jgi:hypothetical protein
MLFFTARRTTTFPAEPKSPTKEVITFIESILSKGDGYTS